jgi:hypothetical protein
MLALTHHVIVKVSALSVGVSNFRDYCILGDDIVIANDAIAKRYSEIMTDLGVGINNSKSIISSTVVEFAKRWIITPAYESSSKGKRDISPIGPGLILQGIRSKIAAPLLFSELIARNFISYQNLFNKSVLVPSCLRKSIEMYFWDVDFRRSNLFIEIINTEKVENLYVQVSEKVKTISELYLLYTSFISIEPTATLLVKEELTSFINIIYNKGVMSKFISELIKINKRKLHKEFLLIVNEFKSL